MPQMVRTQIYLPRDLYEALKQRGEREGLTMAEQIRAALRAYIGNQDARERMLREDDPLWQIVGAGEGPPDASSEHDKYLYGGGEGAE